MPHGQCIFNDAWLKDVMYQTWLASVPGDKHKGKCKVCKKDFDISNMGECSLKSHSSSLKHKNLMSLLSKTQPLGSFFIHGATNFSNSASTASSSTTSHESSTVVSTKSATASSSTQSTPMSSSASMTSTPLTEMTGAGDFSKDTSFVNLLPMDHFVTGNVSLDAEIMWCLRTVVCHYSYASSDTVGSCFQRMFPDSNIAKVFSCGRDKVAYYCNFGLGPYFINAIKQKVAAANWYVLMFDESLNELLGKKQLDIHVRLWDNGQISTRYYTSSFMGHATAQDLFSELQSSVDLCMKNLLQLSMDGPNVNWKVLKLLSEDLHNRCGSKIIDVGSCSLHTVHNAILHGLEKSGWDLGHLFTSLYWLFKDTPARREDFTNITGN